MSDITRTRPNADQADEIIASLDAIAGALGAESTGVIRNYQQMRQLLRLGKLPRYVKIGDLIQVTKENSISVTVTGGVTAATVDEDTFLTAVDSAATHAYEFLYDGAAWRLDEEAVELSAYGVGIAGTPAEGDAVVVHVQADTVYFEAADYGYDVPVNPNLEHTLTLISRDILSYGAILFSYPQALKAITDEEFPSGIAAGTTLHIALNHGAYDASTSEDGTYQFTVTKAIPVGGKIRHTTIGQSLSNGAYGQAHVLGGTFTTYDADYNLIESGLVTTLGSDGTSLGTAAAEDKRYMSGSHLNSTRRQMYGSNRYAHGAQRKWLNSAAAGAASGAIASWWTPSDEFDMPVRTTLPGFLHGLDPEFVACLGAVRKRTFLHAWDQTSGGLTYEDTAETVFQLSMTELGYGANSGVSECSVKADGALDKTGAYALYGDAANADRIKTQNGTARYWFHRSPNPGLANRVRYSAPDGALHGSNASNAGGVVAGLNFM